MAKPNRSRSPKPSTAAKPRSSTKSEKIVRLLKRPSGATITDLQKVTGWQAHSVRGFLSGMIKKRMGRNITSEKSENGERRYRILEEADA